MSRLLGYVAWFLIPIVTPALAVEALYFPPAQGEWERVEPGAVGWDADQLDSALAVAGQRQSSGVVMLYRGKILAERYWSLSNPSRAYENFVTGRTEAGQVIEDVASAQKSIVAVITGIAQQRGYLSITDPVSTYLGAGWSATQSENEAKITLQHLLSMTSGLSDALEFEAEPGTRWRYNTPAYHLIMPVVEAATGLDRDTLTSQWITDKLGMLDSGWVPRPWANADIGVGFATSARDLARFGLMIQAGGRWQNAPVLDDGAFFAEMLSPSQSLNPSYGYLWWLNGQAFALQANAQATRATGALIPSAPSDMVAMQGAGDRKLYLVPSMDLIVVRLGYTGSANGISFNDAFWRALMAAAPEH